MSCPVFIIFNGGKYMKFYKTLFALVITCGISQYVVASEYQKLREQIKKSLEPIQISSLLKYAKADKGIAEINLYWSGATSIKEKLVDSRAGFAKIYRNCMKVLLFFDISTQFPNNQQVVDIFSKELSFFDKIRNKTYCNSSKIGDQSISLCKSKNGYELISRIPNEQLEHRTLPTAKSFFKEVCNAGFTTESCGIAFKVHENELRELLGDFEEKNNSKKAINMKDFYQRMNEKFKHANTSCSRS